MRLIKMHGRKGQNLIEYAVIVSVVSAAMIAMSTYVFRSIQATQQVIQDGFSN
jgi:Flp pilus assembly pilin Flp